MSSEKYVRIILAENLRFLEEGSSAPSKSGAKARPKGVVDAQTVEIPLPPNLKQLTREWNSSRAMVAPGERERKYSSEVREASGEKRLCMKFGARTVNRHR